jgi:hypothetical protein
VPTSSIFAKNLKEPSFLAVEESSLLASLEQETSAVAVAAKTITDLNIAFMVMILLLVPPDIAIIDNVTLINVRDATIARCSLAEIVVESDDQQFRVRRLVV